MPQNRFGDTARSAIVQQPIMAVDRVADFVHVIERAVVAALADEGVAAEPRDTPFTGVWAGDLDADVTLRPSRGSHLVLRAEKLPGLRTAVTAPVRCAMQRHTAPSCTRNWGYRSAPNSKP